MSDLLRVTLIQTALHWQEPAANRADFTSHLAPLAGATDLIVLPEMFTTGFSMSAEQLAEPADGATSAWLREQARALSAAVTGSLIVSEAGQFYNRLLWATPDGRIAHYDKRHLFRMGREHEHFAGGAAPLLVEWRGWRICPLVCYDLRFPVWSRRRPALDYDLLLYVANWPAARRYAWSQLLKARAIENQAYVVGINRIGDDGQGISHAGESAVLDFLGIPLAED
ncbi:MAG TPA: amidohydrolase, partial [Steroidobacteraceae bacterium]